jgi:septum formation protein
LDARGSDPLRSAAFPRLVLASQSPRRRKLLSDHGFEHTAIHPGLDDAQLRPGNVTPAQWVASLAYLKASSGADALRWSVYRHGPALVIGADTICLKNGRFIGQPRDQSDARNILRSLENGSHEVFTGVALVWVMPDGERRRDLLVDRARVTVGTIGTERIEAYLRSGDWRGKAGAYNLFERIEAGWPIKYDGDPTTIMGLPMQALIPRLRQAAPAA